MSAAFCGLAGLAQKLGVIERDILCRFIFIELAVKAERLRCVFPSATALFAAVESLVSVSSCIPVMELRAGPTTGTSLVL